MIWCTDEDIIAVTLTVGSNKLVVYSLYFVRIFKISALNLPTQPFQDEFLNMNRFLLLITS